MRMTLRRIRETKGWKLSHAAKLYHMNVERLRDIEEYRELPTFKELIMMLKLMQYYFDEIVFIIWQDLNDHYVSNEGGKKHD